MKRKDKVTIKKEVYRLKNGKSVKGYRVTAFRGITPLVVWNTMDKKEALKFKRSWED